MLFCPRKARKARKNQKVAGVQASLASAGEACTPACQWNLYSYLNIFVFFLPFVDKLFFLK
jgi:hypothetical protein